MLKKTRKKVEKLIIQENIEEIAKVRSGSYSRNKGNGFERDLVKFFRDELGYEFAKTTRNSSRVLDACSIDLNNIPFLVQAKCGYIKARPKADELFSKMREELKKNVPSHDPIHNYPKLLIHKMDGRTEDGTLVTMTFKDFKRMMIDSKHNLKLIQENDVK